MGKVHAGIARYGAAWASRWAPCVILSGETTVTVRGNGRGGRNAEFLLSLDRQPQGPVYALVGDTDGIDGLRQRRRPDDPGQRYARATALGLSASDELDNNNGYATAASTPRSSPN